MTTAEYVGRRVHMLMWDRHVRQVDLADALGMSSASMSAKLRGRRPWTIDEVIGAAHYLRVTLDELVPDVETWCAAKDSNLQPADITPAQIIDLINYRARHTLPVAI